MLDVRKRLRDCQSELLVKEEALNQAKQQYSALIADIKADEYHVAQMLSGIRTIIIFSSDAILAHCKYSPKQTSHRPTVLLLVPVDSLVGPKSSEYLTRLLRRVNELSSQLEVNSSSVKELARESARRQELESRLEAKHIDTQSLRDQLQSITLKVESEKQASVRTVEALESTIRGLNAKIDALSSRNEQLESKLSERNKNNLRRHNSPYAAGQLGSSTHSFTTGRTSVNSSERGLHIFRYNLTRTPVLQCGYRKAGYLQHHRDM